MNEPEKKRLAIGQTLLGVWWVSWLGIIGGFLLAGVQEYRRELSQGVGSSPFSLALLIVIVFSWVVFYIATSKFEEQWPVVWRLFTMVGTILAIVTMMGIYFFAFVAPRVQ
jgi:drug/metabolite transporter (DMT)-like permease